MTDFFCKKNSSDVFKKAVEKWYNFCHKRVIEYGSCNTPYLPIHLPENIRVSESQMEMNGIMCRVIDAYSYLSNIGIESDDELHYRGSTYEAWINYLMEYAK